MTEAFYLSLVAQIVGVLGQPADMVDILRRDPLAVLTDGPFREKRLPESAPALGVQQSPMQLISTLTILLASVTSCLLREGPVNRRPIRHVNMIPNQGNHWQTTQNP